MNKFWIILEPYTFIWSNSVTILLYNTLSKKAFLAKNNEMLAPIILALEDKRNLYSVLVDENKLQYQTVKDFISILRDSYSGDCVSLELCKNKPMVMYPSLNFNEDMNREIEFVKSQETLGRKILNNLISIDIYLGGTCSYTCDYCDTKYKQIRWCKSNKETLPYDKLHGLLSEISTLNSISVNFFGEIFTYPYINELLKELSSCLFNKKFILDYKYSLDHERKIAHLINSGGNIGLLIGDTERLNQLVALPFLHDKNLECIFSVEGESEFSFLANFISMHNLENVFIYPYFNGTNQDFFRKNIFQDKDDILVEELDKREIFMRQTLNSNFFGKLTVLSNGDILPNVNANSIGNIDHGIKNLIYKEIAEGSYWLQTRNKIEPCKNCLYRVLCSPISNYEIAMGKMDLCNVSRVGQTEPQTTE